MGALGLMILFVGFLTTGATRQKVYRAWRARIGGRISCMVVCTQVAFNYTHVCMRRKKIQTINIFTVHGHHIYTSTVLDVHVLLPRCCYICCDTILEYMCQ